MRPIDRFSAALDHVRDIGAVESFAFLNKRFHPDDLFRTHYFHWKREQFIIAPARKPGIIDQAQAIPSCIDQVDNILPEINLRQPMGKGFVDSTSIFLENHEGTIEIGRSNKEIDILGVSGETGVNTHRISAAEQEWYFVLPKQLDRALVKRSTLRIKSCYFSTIFHGNDTRLRKGTGALFDHDKRPAPNALPFRNR